MRLGQTTIGELASALVQVIGIASTVGVSIEELMAAVATATLAGQSTSQAMTGMKAAFSSIMAPSEQAKKTAQELGLAFDAQALKAKGLQGVLVEVMAATKGNEEQLSKLFGSVEALNTVLNVASGDGETFAFILGEMGNKMGATDSAFRQMADTMIFQQARLAAGWDVLSVRFGTKG